MMFQRAAGSRLQGTVFEMIQLYSESQTFSYSVHKRWNSPGPKRLGLETDHPSPSNGDVKINPLNAELNPICYLLALLAHHFLHFSRIRVKSLTLR